MATAVKKRFPITGMSCASCAANVEKTLEAQKGVKAVGVNFADASAVIEFFPKQTQPQKLKQAVVDAGYDLIIVEDPDQAGQEQERQKQLELHHLRRDMISAAVLTLPIVAIGMFFMNMPYANWVMLVLSTPVVFYFGRRFFIGAWKQLRHGSSNMDTLVAISTGVAYWFSFFNTLYPQYWLSRNLEAHVYFEAAAAIIAFILLGKWLEERAKSHTSTAIKKLMGLQPNTVVRVGADGSRETVPIREVIAGDVLEVKPGEKIPVDGQVLEGHSYVDESMISGEPVPVEVMPGKKLYAGTLNQKGSFTFMAEKVGEQTLLSQIIQMVQQAQGSKAPVQRLVDKVASIFVPTVITLSLVTFTVWMLWGGEQAFTHALLTAITVLVIACPCALGLATPTAIMVGVGKGAENHILIKDAQSLETAHRVNAVVLDKTGTITEGKPVLTDLLWKDDREDAAMAAVLRSMEEKSEHPLASAVVDRLNQAGVEAVELDGFESLTGQGIRADHAQTEYLVGNRSLMDQRSVKMDKTLSARVQELRQQGKTVIYFAAAGSLVAVMAMADKIKDTSRHAIEALQKQHIDVYMLTGDHQQTAAAVAAQVGIKHYKADVMPSDKAAFVKSLQDQGLIVAMVGDGINDSQALAQSDISIAMGKGSDIALDVAGMALITSDLEMIPRAIRLSHSTVAAVKQNLFWAFIYNLVGIPLAAGVLYPFNGFLLNPMIAAAAMAFSSVSVVSNSLRLKWKPLS